MTVRHDGEFNRCTGVLDDPGLIVCDPVGLWWCG